jgi:hypothetical protein
VELGTWNTTDRALPPGRGFWLAAPPNATNALVFTGFVPAAPAPTPVPGWNQLGWVPSSDQFPAGEGGDQLLLYRSGGYVITDFDPAQGWSNAPAPATGEGFWYFRAQGAPTSAPCLYFNNYVPFANTTSRLFYEASPLAVGGQAGAAYTIQQSSDLVHWTNVVSIPSLPPAGTNLSLDVPATPQFFRTNSP